MALRGHVRLRMPSAFTPGWLLLVIVLECDQFGLSLLVPFSCWHVWLSVILDTLLSHNLVDLLLNVFELIVRISLFSLFSHLHSEWFWSRLLIILPYSFDCGLFRWHFWIDDIRCELLLTNAGWWNLLLCWFGLPHLKSITTAANHLSLFIEVRKTCLRQSISLVVSTWYWFLVFFLESLRHQSLIDERSSISNTCWVCYSPELIHVTVKYLIDLRNSVLDHDIDACIGWRLPCHVTNQLITHSVTAHTSQSLHVRVMWRAAHCLEHVTCLEHVAETSYRRRVECGSWVHGWMHEALVVLVPLTVLQDDLYDVRVPQNPKTPLNIHPQD